MLPIKGKENSIKLFMNSTKVGYGRPDIMYLLDDFGRITGDNNLAKNFTQILIDNFAFKSCVVSWDNCISTLAQKLAKEKFDFSIGIGSFGEMVVKDLLKRKVEMGDFDVFYVTRISNSAWEKIGYVQSEGKPTIKKQMTLISNKIKKRGYKKIAIVDDVTYSGGTRKTLSDIKKFSHIDVCGIDLITLKSAKNDNNDYKKWFSGITVKHDPYPTLNSKKQADVMSVSEFVFPSKCIGRVKEGSINANQILYDGKYDIISKQPYTANNERNEVYFGKEHPLVCKKINDLGKKMRLDNH